MAFIETLTELLKTGTPSIYVLLFIIISFLLKEWDNFKKTLNDLRDKVNRYENNANHVYEKIDHTNEIINEKLDRMNEKVNDIKTHLKELENDHRRYTQIGTDRIH